MNKKTKEKYKADLKAINKRLNNYKEELELLYMILEDENKDVSDIESELKSAKFQLDNMNSRLSDKNNSILLKLLKNKKAT